MDYRIKARKTIIRRDRCCGFPPGSQSISRSISEWRWREADYTEFISIEVRHARLSGGGFSLCGGGARATSSARSLNHRKLAWMCARAQVHSFSRAARVREDGSTVCSGCGEHARFPTVCFSILICFILEFIYIGPKQSL